MIPLHDRPRAGRHGRPEKRGFSKDQRPHRKVWDARPPRGSSTRPEPLEARNTPIDEEPRSDIIEGRNPVVEALRSGRPISRILLAENVARHSIIAEIVHLARGKGIPVEYVERSILDQKSAGASQGVLAYAAAKEYLELEALLAISKEKNEPALYCLLDGVEDPHNLGAVLRTADAAAFHGVVIRSRRAVGLTPTVAKASAGAIEYVPVARVANIGQAIETLKKNNIWVVGIDTTGETEYTKVDFKPPTAIVVGGEGQGISPLVRQRCDAVARIPMKGRINSLNASVAAALVMYEALKQRSG